MVLCFQVQVCANRMNKLPDADFLLMNNQPMQLLHEFLLGKVRLMRKLNSNAKRKNFISKTIKAIDFRNILFHFIFRIISLC